MNKYWKCMAPVRWNDGVLEQLWVVHVWDRVNCSLDNTNEYEWRPVPQKEDIKEHDAIYWLKEIV